MNINLCLRSIQLHPKSRNLLHLLSVLFRHISKSRVKTSESFLGLLGRLCVSLSVRVLSTEISSRTKLPIAPRAVVFLLISALGLYKPTCSPSQLSYSEHPWHERTVVGKTRRRGRGLFNRIRMPMIQKMKGLTLHRPIKG